MRSDDENGIRMKVLRNLSPGAHHYSNLVPDTDGDGPGTTDELDHLILMPKPKRNNWGVLLRALMIFFLLASVISIFSLIGKEWYLLSHQSVRLPNPMDNSSAEYMCELKPEWRFDCFPGVPSTATACADRGCCWSPEPENGEPFCYFPSTFTYYKWEKPIETVYGLEAKLSLLRESPYPKNIKNLTIRVYYETEGSLRVKIFDSNSARYEVPLQYATYDKKSASQNYLVQFYTTGFRVYRKGQSFPLFDTNDAPLIYADQFIQITSSIPSKYVYGLGEVEDTLARNMHFSRSVLWTHDRVPAGNSNLYGAHPFYFVMEETGSSHGVFLANSNAMEVILQPGPAVTFRTIGGILDFRIFVGPTQADVMQQYTNIIGKPHLPPYWSLGFHLCRFNYGSLEHTEEILESNVKAGIPIDVQWNDLDYMQNQNDFTFDRVKFSKLPDFVKKLHSRGMYYVPLVDPGISGGETPGSYAPYDDGLTQGIFIKDSADKVFVGKVWNPVSTVWPDFSHPNVTHYWMTQLSNFHDSIPIDGAWIDMNEPSNFWDGTKDGKCDLNSTLDYPPYLPDVDGGKLHYKTICASAKQYAGSHYNVHNLYGTFETIATYKALGDIRAQRPFIISRSTFPGQGHYGGHWTGDVVSSWDHMRKSIPQILNFGLFGIPMVGADICGFNGNTTVALCKRWQQLGAFYPFSRNHNTDDGIPQDPASLGQEVVDAARETLTVRYSLLPYIYTLFFHSHITGEPVARAMFYEFPKDPMTYMIDTQFMLGSSVLIIPVLDENHTGETIKAYLPLGWWYQHYYTEIIDSLGEEKEVKVPEEFHSIPVLYRGGTIVTKQKPGNTTTQSRKNKFSVHAFLDKNGNAKGELYWDDGITPNPDVLGSYNHYNLVVSQTTFSMRAERETYLDANLFLEAVKIRGILSSVASVLVNNVGWTNYTLNTKSRTLTVDTDRQNVTFNDGLTVTWTVN